MTRAIVFVWAVLASSVARADPEATAKVLFDEGKTLFAEGNYGKACEKLDASFKLNALSGTRGLLAACYEKIGKLASAWNAYRDSAAIAERQGNSERAQVARDKAAELEPQLAHVTIDASAVAKTPAVRIAIDGVEQPSAALNREIPIDGGPHVIEATAPDYKRWRTTLDIQDRERQTVAVPALVADPTARLAAEERAAEIHRLVRRRKLIAYGLGGGGGAALAVGLGFGIAAKIEWNRALDRGCTHEGICTDVDAKHTAETAARNANVATVAGVIGLVLAGVGGAVYFTAPSERAYDATLRVSPTIGPAGIVLGGRF